ncbi:hypothetical protein HDU79_009326 [Rhizoclosmatium sp. JEL0117]|nr:hypothetical protein HDU79_009326 [Rhizoclosmatium sp. JEL0117]
MSLTPNKDTGKPSHRRASSFDSYAGLLETVKSRVREGLDEKKRQAKKSVQIVSEDVIDEEDDTSSDDLGWEFSDVDDDDDESRVSPLPFRQDLETENEESLVVVGKRSKTVTAMLLQGADSQETLEEQFDHEMKNANIYLDLHERYFANRSEMMRANAEEPNESQLLQDILLEAGVEGMSVRELESMMPRKSQSAAKETEKKGFFEPVVVKRGSVSAIASITLTRHHFVLTFAYLNDFGKKDHWVSYSTIQSIDRHFPTPDGYHPVIISCRNFSVVRLSFAADQDATDVCTNLQKLINTSSVDQLFAFSYTPNQEFTSTTGWAYDAEGEFRRMGLGVKTDAWRITTINKDFSFCPTYPQILAVPSKISDNVLKHAGKFRSKCRIPALSYIHRTNMVSITRCSQPLVGLKQNRSIQDEKLVESIFTTGKAPPVKNQMHLIIDARPAANVMGQTALGAGVEGTDNYRDCKVVLLGIQNIHVMRDSINKLMEVSVSGDTGASLRAGLDRSGWLNHIRTVLDGTLMIVKSVHLHNTHALVHCSDGWDRTAQLCSLSEICLDPYYRTMAGFQTLVEKEWMAFGHKFRDRLGLLSKPNRDSGPSVGSQLSAASKSMQYSFTSAAKNLLKQPSSSRSPITGSRTHGSNGQLAGPQGSMEVVYPSYLASHEISPIFTQFLDCVYQIWIQFPTHFEFSEKYLLTLNSHLTSCQYGTFLFNNEKERQTFLFKSPTSGGTPVPAAKAAYSVWDYFSTNKESYLNPLYIPPESRTGSPTPAASATDSPIQIYTDDDVLFPSPESTRYWMGLYASQTDPNAEFGDASNMPGCVDVKPISAAFVAALGGGGSGGVGKSGVQLTVGDLDDESDSGAGLIASGGGGSGGGNGWQSAFTSTAASVSSFATNTWSIGGGWMGGSSTGASNGNAPVPIDPLVRNPGISAHKSVTTSTDRMYEAAKKQETPPTVQATTPIAPTNKRMSIQERLTQTVQRQMSDLDLRKAGSTSPKSTATITAETAEAAHNEKKVAEPLPHPLWTATDE